MTQMPGWNFKPVPVARNILKVAVEGHTDVKLFPEEGEPVNILNIKRGIISTLMVPEINKEETKEMVHRLLLFFPLFHSL